MNQALKERAEPIFQKTFKDDSLSISDELTANDVAQWDSLSHMALINALEKEFKIKFKLKELMGMKNVGDLMASIEAKTSA